MDDLLKSGRIIFSLGMAGLGVMCLFFRDFIVGRPPGWNAGTGNITMAYITGSLLIIVSLALLFKIKPILAAAIMAALIFLFSVTRQLGNFRADWLNGLKTLALFGGTLIVLASFARTRIR
jgi:hypothetical protein